MLKGGASIRAAVDGHYQDQQYTDFDISLYPASGAPNANFIQKAYLDYNANLSYHSANGKFTFGIYGNNLSNEIHKVTTNGQLNYVNDPRTYGMYLSLKY